MATGAGQAIVTRYIPASTHRPTRVSATASAGVRVIINWDYGKNNVENHNDAARALADRLGWAGHWHMGSLPLDRGFVYVDDNCQVVTGGRHE